MNITAAELRAALEDKIHTLMAAWDLDWGAMAERALKHATENNQKEFELPCIYLPGPKDQQLPCYNHDDVMSVILNTPVDVQVRNDWYKPYEDSYGPPKEYAITLTEGDPCFRIVGELNGSYEPVSANLVHTTKDGVVLNTYPSYSAYLLFAECFTYRY